MKFPPGRRRSGRSFWLKELQAPSTWTLTATSAPARISKTPDDTATRTLRWGGDRWTHVALRAHFWFILALFFAQIYFEFTSNLLYTASPVTTHKLVCFPSNWLNSPYSCYTTEWMRARMNKKKEEKGGMTVFVWGANEPTNSMNRWLSRFTVDSSAFKVRRWCVTCNASHWQDITQLCLAGLCCSCQYSRFASPLACIALP